MKTSSSLQWLVRVSSVVGLFLAAGCGELVDPTKIDNPQITEDNLSSNPIGGTTSLVTGLRRQFTVTMGIQSLIGDLVSDNLDNRTSFYENALDLPATITPRSFTYGPSYEGALQLNALADFGIANIIPRDTRATNNQRAEVYFYKGMALMLLAENYTGFPITEKGPVVSAAQARQIAVAQFYLALSLNTLAPMRNNCLLALARAHRMSGDKTRADSAAAASLALAGGTTYIFYAQMDPTGGVTSTVFAALVSRASNDIQPLPRLDFLDPKYTLNTTGTPCLKAEEAYLIRAEVALSNGDLPGARGFMTSAVTLARGRSTVAFTDNDTRQNRPNDSTMTVQADASSPAIGGLIKRRSGSTVTAYPISYTSLTATDIANLASIVPASQQRLEHIRVLYLLRQEIFFAEGRRMGDLGIRLPVTQRQIDGNPNVSSSVTSVLVPSYIPATDEMKLFSIAGSTVTILWDMNKVVANNINLVSPFAPIP